MSDERPEALLKSALEKIIYFEARSQQLSTDLQQSRDESERLRRELSAAAQREIALRAQVAGLEVTAARSVQDREEQLRLNEALRRERKELIGKLIDASRLHATGEEVAGEPEFDLASFISELRGEALGLREAPSLCVAACVPEVRSWRCACVSVRRSCRCAWDSGRLSCRLSWRSVRCSDRFSARSPRSSAMSSRWSDQSSRASSRAS